MTESDEPAQVARLSWIQGMRPPEPDRTHELTWQELLFRRLTWRFEGIPTGDKTARAEEALEFPVRMTYFYVGRCVPDFGSNTVASWPLSSPALTTPFDTGSLAKPGMIVSSPPLSDDDRGRFVVDHSFDVGSYAERMSAWLAEAYAEPSNYVSGVKPAHHAIPQIVLDECAGDQRIWTWEARLPADDYAVPPLQTRVIYFSEGIRELYVDWIEQTDLLMAEERMSHMEDIYSYSKEVDDAALGMLGHLRGELMV